LGVAPHCDFHIKSDVALDNFNITFKDTTNEAQIDIQFTLPADTVNWTYVYLDLTSEINTLNTPVLAEVQWDPNAAATIWIDDFRMGEAAKPDLSPPTIDPPEDILVFKNAGPQQVTLTGITDGEPEIVQGLTISAISTNTGIIPNPSVSAIAGDSATLSFTPVADTVGQAYIKITLKDNGAVQNTTVDSFLVVMLVDGGTGYLQDFNVDVVPPEVSSLPGHSFSMVDSSLRVNVNRSQRWYGFDYKMGAVVDISGNPYLNVKVRTESDFVLQAFLIDYAGNGYAIELIGGQYLYNELITGEYYFDHNRIYEGDGFLDVLFDFSGVDEYILDLSKITGIKLVANGTSLNHEGVYLIDELALGDSAKPYSYIGQIPYQSFYVNAAGTQKILIPEIKNVDTIQVSGAESLIENVVMEAINYETHTENNRTVTYGQTWLTFTLMSDATGTDTVTLTSIGNSGYDNNSCRFLLTVSANMPPEMDALDSLVTAINTENTVKLSGISDGDRDVEQSIQVEAGSDNASVIDTVYVDHSDNGKYGKISFTALSAGDANITVRVTDEEGADTSISFKVSAFNSLNGAPLIAPVNKITVVNNAGEQTIQLTGIGDGDGSNQTLTITAESSNDTILPSPVINYTQGDSTAELVYTPLADTVGAVTITVTLSDDGGTAENDGDKTTVMTFEIEAVTPPVKGLVVDLSDPDALSWFGAEGEGEFVWTEIVDTLGMKALRTKYNEKWTYAGTWFALPLELDLSGMPVVSYDILSVGNESWHWNYFYHVHGTDGNVDRNIQNSEANQHLVPADTWTTVSFDYRDPGDLNNNQGEPIDPSRINVLLINWHNTKPTWPFTNTSGVIYYTNIRFGDSAVYDVKYPSTTIDLVPEQSVFENSGDHTITLTGLSNGEGSTDGLTVSAASSAPAYIPDPVIGSINPDGTADLTFTAAQEARIRITVTVTHATSDTSEISFFVSVVGAEPDGIGNITIDLTEEHQTIRGLGTFENSPRFASLYAEDLGASAVRIGIIGRGWEAQNDNNDPNILNKDGFDYSSFDWDYYRDLKDKGVEVFILTSWSPPAWMKRNLSTSHREQANAWEYTDNILEPYYYDEFAESMVAVVKAFKEEVDIDLLALGLQNEPYFNEPYPSAILSGEKFAELITVVGDRFAAEGLDHVGFFMPEQVFGGSSWGIYSNDGYLAALKANSEADAYVDYFAVHGYDQTGVTSGFPSFAGWTDLWEKIQDGANPKEMWMSETHRSYDDDFDNAIGVAVAIHGSLWAGNISLWTNWAFETMQLSNNEPTPIYYISKNFFKYIRPGAVRVTTESDYADVMATAFKNTDGSTSIVVINKGTFAAPIRFVGDNLPEEYTMYRTTETENCLEVGTYHASGGPQAIPGNCVITFVAESNSMLTIDYVPDVYVDKNSGESIVNLSGISDGAGSVDNLSLSFENDNPGLFSAISLSAIESDGTASLSFTPATDMLGTAKITIEVSDNDQHSRKVTFYIVVGEPSSIIEPEQTKVIVYPVPATDQINIRLEDPGFEQIMIRDLAGRVLKQARVTSNLVTIGISDLQKGVYLLELSGKDERNVTRFIVQ
ncbi:MAG: hypothetical protein AMS23_09010, partial [Bacteroides sp. SM1_62]